MDQLPSILVLLMGLSLLVLGGELLVRGSVATALKARISPLIVGLTVVSFGTSAPELFTSLSAALNGSSNIAVGNIVGSNIANIALILGITALVKPVLVERGILNRDAPLMILASLAMWIVARNALITSTEGSILLLAMAGFIGMMILYARRERKLQTESASDEVDAYGKLAEKPGYQLVGMILLGGVGLYFGSGWFVRGAQDMATWAGVSERVIGLTVVAFGTSVPELVASVIAAVRGHAAMALGNVIGSNLFNILLVLGATASIRPLEVDPAILSWDIWWMIGLALALIPLALSKKIGRVKGAALVLLYIGYIATTWPTI